MKFKTMYTLSLLMPGVVQTIQSWVVSHDGIVPNQLRAAVHDGTLSHCQYGGKLTAFLLAPNGAQATFDVKLETNGHTFQLLEVIADTTADELQKVDVPAALCNPVQIRLV